MGRKRSHEDDLPEHTHEFEHEHRSGPQAEARAAPGVAVGIAWVMRRNQRRAKLDEGIWHGAPSA